MLSAETARKMSDSVTEPKIQKEVEKISKFIEKAAKRGHYSIVWDCKLAHTREVIADIFREQGYRVSTRLFSLEIKISWGREY